MEERRRAGGKQTAERGEGEGRTRAAARREEEAWAGSGDEVGARRTGLVCEGTSEAEGGGRR